MTYWDFNPYVPNLWRIPEKTPQIEGFKVATLTGFETESRHVGIRAKTDKKRAFTDI